ncbi:MAG: DUF3137 domain-containing protein [Lachnospiraceae bacterium]|nr:DUF3137 domain-containing protein [Lachnospiraceae bacterium]
MEGEMQELLELGLRIKRRDRIGIVILLIGFVSTIVLYNTPVFAIGIGIIVAGIIQLCVTSFTLEKKYRRQYKETMVNHVAKEFFEDFTYSPEKGFTKQYLNDMGIMSFGNEYKSEDMLSGVCSGVQFSRADVYIADTSTDSEGHSSTTVYFEGQWIEFEPHKRFGSDLQIIQKGFGFSKKRKGFWVKKELRRHELETEDVDFNKRFTCMCQNDAEAFYLLTPSLMQAIRELTEVLPYKMMVAFVNRTMHVLIDTKRDSLEPSAPKGGNFDRQIADVRQDIGMIPMIIQKLGVDKTLYRE